MHCLCPNTYLKQDLFLVYIPLRELLPHFLIHIILYLAAAAFLAVGRVFDDSSMLHKHFTSKRLPLPIQLNQGRHIIQSVFNISKSSGFLLMEYH